MTKVKVNLLPVEDKVKIKGSAGEKITEKISPDQPVRGDRIKKIIASIIIVTIIVLAVFSSSVVFSDENLIKSLSKLNLLQQMSRLMGSGNKNLVGENEDRINILIIGMGGQNHEGGTLADTIILGSFKPSTQQVAMVSIPRDLSLKTNNYDWLKINALNAYAEKKEAGSGGREMARALSELLDTPINYYVTVDFAGFEKLINEFGGVDIEVERDLIDPQYPISGQEYVFPIENRYENLYIKKGQQHMDGQLALKYARSRHALGLEGSDFARSRRQQKILAALKEKIFKVETFFNPKKINSLLNAYNEHIHTNLEIWEMLSLVQLGKNIETSKIISQTLSDGPSGFVYSQIINGAYVLLLKDSSYGEIRAMWKNIFSAPGSQILTSTVSESLTAALTKKENAANQISDETPNKSKTETEPAQTLPLTPIIDYKKEGATIDIRNGTWVTGLAGQQQINLEESGFEVINVANANNHDYLKTIIYDLSEGKNPATAAELAKIYKTTPTSSQPLAIASQADFLIILGQN